MNPPAAAPVVGTAVSANDCADPVTVADSTVVADRLTTTVVPDTSTAPAVGLDTVNCAIGGAEMSVGSAPAQVIVVTGVRMLWETESEKVLPTVLAM